MKKVILATLISASSLSAFAQEEETPSPGSWEFGIGIGHANIDQEAARSEFIDDGALNFSLTAMYLKNNWMTTLGTEIISYDDDASFSQDVTSPFFGDSTEDSSATGILFTGAFGYRWTYQENDAASTYLQAGASFMIDSSRGIDNCSNCYSEDIDIEGGGFIRGGVHYSWNAVGLGIEYTQFMSGDLDNTIMLHLTTSFR